jgi:hypothetical protein
LDHLTCEKNYDTSYQSKCMLRCRADNDCAADSFCRDGRFCTYQVMCFFGLFALVLFLVHNSILFKQVIFVASGAVQKGEGQECQRDRMCWKSYPYCTDWKCSKQQGGCFPSHATVQVEDRGRVRMADLAYGDRVLARDHQGRLVFREVGSYRWAAKDHWTMTTVVKLLWRTPQVYLFGHRTADNIGTYFNIRTAAGPILQLTPR